MSAPASLVVELDVQVRLSQKVDVVAYFNGFDAAAQRHYAHVSVTEWGYDDEFQRPMAFLMETAHEEAIPFDLIPGGASTPMSGDITDSTEAVAGRTGRERDWSLDDFYALADAVTWIAEIYLDRVSPAERTEADERLATRLAARTETPLF